MCVHCSIFLSLGWVVEAWVVGGLPPDADPPLGAPLPQGADLDHLYLPGEDPDLLPGEDPDHLPGEDPDHLPGEDPDLLPGVDPDLLPGEDPDLQFVVDPDLLFLEPVGEPEADLRCLGGPDLLHQEGVQDLLSLEDRDLLALPQGGEGNVSNCT